MFRTFSVALTLGAMALGIGLSTQQLRAIVPVGCGDYICSYDSQCAGIAGLGCNACQGNRCGIMAQ